MVHNLMLKIKHFLKFLIMNTPASMVFIAIYLCRYSNISFLKFLFAKERSYVFMTAMHNNAGDLAQTVCIDEWIYKNYPDSIVLNVGWTAPEAEKILRKICAFVNSCDHIFIHSGYNITDIEDAFAAPTVFPSHKILLELLPNHTIVFLPQTVEYKSIEKWSQIRSMYSKHEHIIFISRDKISQEYAERLLPRARHLAYPDMVTAWIGKFSFDRPVKDIYLCLRRGNESILSEQMKNELIDRMNQLGVVETGDTDVDGRASYYRQYRKEVVLKKIREFSQFKIVVTDRFHGVVFSLIAGRPVVVLKTAGHKVQAMMDWFPEEFHDYVYYIEDIKNQSEICFFVQSVLLSERRPIQSRYFEEKVFNKLKAEIEGLTKNSGK